MSRDTAEVRLTGTEEQVQTAKGLIEDFVNEETSGLSYLYIFHLSPKAYAPHDELFC